MRIHRQPVKTYGIQWLIISCLLLYLPTMTVAETTSSAVTEAEVSDDILLERTRQALQTVTAVAERLEELAQRETELTTEIDKQIVQRESLTLPDVDMPATPVIQPEAAQALVKAWSERIETLKNHEELYTTQQALAKQHREAVLKLAAEHRLLAEAMEKLIPLADQVQQRQTAGALNAEQVPTTLQPLLKKYQPDALDTQADKWQAAAARDTLMLDDISARLTTLTADLATANTAQQQANAWLEEANRRTEIAKEFEGRDFSDLTALFATQLTTWQTELEGVDTQISVLAETSGDYTQAKTDIEALTPPDPSDYEVDESIASLRDAKQHLLVSEATVTFRQTRLEKLTTLQTQLEELQTTAQTTVENAQKLLYSTIELEVLAGVINAQYRAMSRRAKRRNTLPKAITEQLVSNELAKLRPQLAALKMMQATQTTQAETLQNDLIQAEQAIAEAQKNVLLQQKQVEQETEWATFINNARSLETTELLKAFENSLAKFTEAKVQVDAGEADIANSRANYQQALTEFQNFKDPNALDNISRTEDFESWYEGEGLQLPQLGEEDTDHDDDKILEPTAEKVTAVEDDGTETAEGTNTSAQETVKSVAAIDITKEALTQTRLLRDQWVVRYVESLQEWHNLRDNLLVGAQAFQEYLTAHAQKLDKAFALARQTWGAATTLQVRSGNGDITPEQLPEAIKEWVSREQIVLLQTEISSLQDELDTVQQKHEKLSKNESYTVFVTPFDDWKSNLDRQISHLNERLDLEQTHVPPDPDKMNEFEKYRYNRDVDERLEEDESWYELIIGAVVSKQMESTNKLFRGYYEQLSELEYQLENLHERTHHTEKLIELHEAMRDIFAVLETEFEKIVKVEEIDLEVRLAKLKAIFTPAESANILAELKEETGVTVTTSELPQLPSSTDPEVRAKAQQALMAELLEYWAVMEGYEALWRKATHERAELGGVDTTIDGLKDVIASLKSSGDEINQRIARLMGHSHEQLQALPPEEQPETVEERRFYLQGEIGILREERLGEMNWAAINTLGWLIFIPFAGFLAIYIVNFIGHRKLTHISQQAEAEGASDDLIDQEARFKMLLHVFSSAWTFLVIVLSIIYMFKAVNVDVLPLIASAGVLGLAIAFGAQQLVSDFFSGFFILLENQFRRGDTVEINGVIGRVERITPRITVIKDGKGALHYMPNGGIKNVSNLSRQEAFIVVDVPVAYDQDNDSVMNVLQHTCDELAAEPHWNKHLMGTSLLGMKGFEDYAVIYAVELKTRAGEQGGAARELRKRIKINFEQQGIKIPQRSSNAEAAPPPAPVVVNAGHAVKPVLGAKG